MSAADQPSLDREADDPLAVGRRVLRAAHEVVVFSGAGLGADSGIPTFRDEGGLWRGFRATELATPNAFERQPEVVWQWYCWRRRIIAEAIPHPGHRAIAEFEARRPSTTVVTQNVDGMHQRAGNCRVLELHGSIWRRHCSGCDHRADDRELEFETVPVCACGARQRPGVVWFGESLPSGPWEQAAAAMSQADAVVVVGTSAVVQPAASLVSLATRGGAAVVEINPQPALDGAASDGVTVISMRAAVALPLLLDIDD